MLRITSRQFEVLQSEAVSTFEASMIERCGELSPMLPAVLGRDGMLAAVRAAKDRAASHGFTNIGSARLFIELSLLFGSGFDADVQYPWAGESLGNGDASTQIGRSQTLFERSMEAMERIHGPDGSLMVAALRRLQALILAPPPLRAEDFQAVVLAEMARVHPQKFDYVGEPALRSLIAAGAAEASAHGLVELPDVLLVTFLMFAFGQGCPKDPLYPWIGRTLRSEKISTPVLRAGQLKEKSLIWIRAVVANTTTTTTKGVRS
jgi:hypothetical protein